MSEVPHNVRQRLIKQARYRCCLHRRIYLQQQPYATKRTESLDVHHVEFQSCGGSNEESNLVPICPTCHQGIHRGHIVIGNAEVLESWWQWKALSQTVPPSLVIGSAPIGCAVQAEMNLYGIDTTVSVARDVTYGNFRKQLLAATVNSLRSADRHFPFPNQATWSISSDKRATAGKWLEELAVTVLIGVREPLRFEVNMPIAMSRIPPRILMAVGADQRL